MCDVQQDGPHPVLSMRSVPKTASPHGDVLLQITVGREGFPALNLARHLKSPQRVGDRARRNGWCWLICAPALG